MDFNIERINSSHISDLSKIVKTTLEEFGGNIEGTSFNDDLLQAFNNQCKTSNASYFVALKNQVVFGGGGIGHLSGEPYNYCELQKFFLLPEARGRGLGKKILSECFDFAVNCGYDFCYLETMPSMKSALGLYERSGFKYLYNRLGKTGHFNYTIWMIKDLKSY